MVVVEGYDESIEKGWVGLGLSISLMDYDVFCEFLVGMFRWVILDVFSML